MIKRFGFMFVFLRSFLRLFMRSYRIDKTTLPDLDQPIVFVSHHENLKGPIRILIWTPIFMRTWVLSTLTNKEEAYKHFRDFTFSVRFGFPKTIANLLAKPVSRVTAYILNQIRVIPVFRKSRKIVETLSESVETIAEKVPVLIFPDVDYSSDAKKMGDIYEGFLMIEKMYYRKFKEHVNFIPMYANRRKFKIQFGTPVQFNDSENFNAQRSLVAEELHSQLNKLVDKI